MRDVKVKAISHFVELVLGSVRRGDSISNKLYIKVAELLSAAPHRGRGHLARLHRRGSISSDFSAGGSHVAVPSRVRPRRAVSRAVLSASIPCQASLSEGPPPARPHAYSHHSRYVSPVAWSTPSAQ